MTGWEAHHRAPHITVAAETLLLPPPKLARAADSRSSMSIKSLTY